MAKEMESGKYCNMGKYLTKSALYYLLQIYEKQGRNLQEFIFWVKI